VGKHDDPVVMSFPRDAQADESVGAWAKSYYFAVRDMMDSILRPYDLGRTQWYVLHQLVNNGPTMQRDLARMLQIERATMTGIVGTLVRKTPARWQQPFGSSKQPHNDSTITWHKRNKP
jgi:hypothetical protein